MTTPNSKKDAEKLDAPYNAYENLTWCRLEKNWGFFKNKTKLAIMQPNNSILEHLPQRNETSIHIRGCM